MIFLCLFQFNHQKLSSTSNWPYFSGWSPKCGKTFRGLYWPSRTGKSFILDYLILILESILYKDLTLLKEQIQKECLIHSETCHRCVIKSKFYFEAGAYFEHLSNFLSKVYIVMEFAKHGSLRNYLRRWMVKQYGFIFRIHYFITDYPQLALCKFGIVWQDMLRAQSCVVLKCNAAKHVFRLPFLAVFDSSIGDLVAH